MAHGVRARLGVFLLLGLIIVAACTVTPGTSGGPDEVRDAPATTAAATPAAQATAAVTPAPSEPAPPSANGSPSPGTRPTLSPGEVPHADPSLEALLPARIGDVELIRMSAPGPVFDTGGDVCSLVCPAEARLMAEGVGAEVDDETIAFAYDAELERYALVAFRVRGASGIELRDARIAMFDSEVPYPLIDEMTVGDTNVTVAIRSWFGNDTQFMVARDDALIVIRYPTDEHDGSEPVLPDEVATIVAALPEPSTGSASVCGQSVSAVC